VDFKGIQVRDQKVIPLFGGLSIRPPKAITYFCYDNPEKKSNKEPIKVSLL
jgi:hypothetical protein